MKKRNLISGLVTDLVRIKLTPDPISFLKKIDPRCRDTFICKNMIHVAVDWCILSDFQMTSDNKMYI